MLGFIVGVFVGGTITFLVFAILGVAKMDDRDEFSCSKNNKNTKDDQAETKVGCMFDE
mgnify:FL=1